MPEIAQIIHYLFPDSENLTVEKRVEIAAYLIRLNRRIYHRGRVGDIEEMLHILGVDNKQVAELYRSRFGRNFYPLHWIVPTMENIHQLSGYIPAEETGYRKTRLYMLFHEGKIWMVREGSKIFVDKKSLDMYKKSRESLPPSTISLEQAAIIVHKSPHFLRDRIEGGLLPATIIGEGLRRRYGIMESDLYLVNSTENDETFTLEQAAIKFHKSHRTLRKRIKEGSLPATVEGNGRIRRYRIKKSDLEKPVENILDI